MKNFINHFLFFTVRSGLLISLCVLKVAKPDNIERRKRFIVKAMFINFFSALKKFVQNYSLS